MRLGFVYDAVHPWETGGVQTRVWELGRRLAETHDVHWYGLRYWDGPARLTREGVTLHGVAEPGSLYVDGRRSISQALAFAARVAGPLRRADLDVIDCQEFPYFPAVASKLATLTDDTRLLLTWHEVWDDYWYEYLGWPGVAGKAVERLTARLPDAHVAVSERTRTEVAALGARDPTLVPNGVDRTAVAEAPPAGREVTALFVGRLIAEKGASLVVEAIAHLLETGAAPDVTGCLVGEGPAEAAVDRAIAETGLGDRVRRLPFREERAEILGLMKAADVVVLPSRREGFGLVALEALACGTPVVTTAHPQNAATELVDDGTTGAITERTPEGIATGIQRARTCETAACQAAAEPYRWDRLADRMEACYRGLV